MAHLIVKGILERWALKLLAALTAWVVSCGWSGPALAALQITEVMFDPTNDSAWEWIEVRNTGAAAVDLDGWLAFSLQDSEPANFPQPTIDGSLAANTTIPAGGVAIIYDGTQTAFPSFEANDASFRDAWSLPSSVPVIAANFFPQLSNTPGSPGQSIGFWQNYSDFEADLVSSGAGRVVGGFNHAQFSLNFSSGFPAPPSGRSITWRGTGNQQLGGNWRVSDFDHNGIVESDPLVFPGDVNSTEDFGNPGVVPAGQFPNPGLHITEIMYDPDSDEPDWEWVEIYNNSGSTKNLAGYVLDDNNSSYHSAANIASGSIPHGGVAILYNSAVSSTSFRAAWGGDLNLIRVTGWSSARMGLNNDSPNDSVALWSSYFNYRLDSLSEEPELQTRAVAKQRFDEGDDFPNLFTNGPSIYLGHLSLNPDDGLHWVNALEGDGLSFPANAIGGTITLHPGGDLGSPGYFAAPVVNDADFDNNNIVSGQDFLIWQRNFGLAVGAGNAQGDANGDGNVNALDLAIWNSQYGQAPPQGMSLVPEPVAISLAGLALAPWGLCRRTRL